MNENPEFPTWIMTLIALGFFGGLAGFVFWLRERRRAGFEALAERYGMEYYEDGSRAVMPPAEFTEEIVGGLVVDSRVGQALVGEVQGMSIAVCEVLRFRASSGGSERRHYSLCVAFVTLPGVELPVFAMNPRSVWRRLPGWGLSQGVDFAETPAFARRYAVTGGDAESIRGAIRTPLREYMARLPGRCVRCYGSELAWFRPARMLRWSAFRPSEADRLLAETVAFLRLLRESEAR